MALAQGTKRASEAVPDTAVSSKRQREDDNDAIVDDMVIGVNDMPFVNREEEVVELLEQNVKAMWHLDEGQEVTDYRPLRVCVAAQMYGSGKTTLGKHFIGELGKELTSKNVQRRVSELRSKPCAGYKLFADYFEAHWAKAQALKPLYVNLRGVTLHDVVSKVAYAAGLEEPTGGLGMALAKLLLDANGAARRQGHQGLFVHFDEVGELGNDVRKLRDAVHVVWVRMNETRVQRQQQLPWIFFYLSGKGVPLSALQGPSSPVGTKWIILRRLEDHHIQEIRSKVLQELYTDAEAERLDRVLSVWTGGAPRLLLYTLRFLKHRRPYICPGAPEKSSAMEEAYRVFKGILIVAGDIFMGQLETGAAERGILEQAWLQLAIMAQLKVPCRSTDEIALSTGEVQPIEKIMSRLNVYIEPKAAEEDSFYIAVYEFVKRFVRATFMKTNFQVIQIFGSTAGMEVNAAEVLEHLVVYRIVVYILLTEQASSWGEVLRPLLDGSDHAGKSAILDRFSPLVQMPKVTRQTTKQLQKDATQEHVLLLKTLHPDDLSKAVELLRPNKVYWPGPQSHSADTIIKQEAFVLEVQDKSGMKSGLNLATVGQELEKSIKAGPVVLLFISLTLGEELGRWIGDKCLTLRPGIYQAEKDGRFLCFRPLMEQCWTHKIYQGEWAELTEKLTVKKPQIIVREHLEVIIPSAAILSEFLGEEDYKAMCNLSAGQVGPQVNLSAPFVSKFFFHTRGFASRAAAPSSAAAPESEGLITVERDGAEAKVLFRRSDQPAAIKEAIRSALQLPLDAPFRLQNDRGIDLTISGTLPDGRYKVFA